jgi:putative transposase
MRSLYFAVKLRRFGVVVSSAAGALGAVTTREGGIAGEISDPASAESGIFEGITMGSVSFALKCKLQTVKCLTLIGTEGEAGLPTAKLCRQHGLSPATFYKMKAKYGGMDLSDAKRLKQLEDENAKLKRVVADVMLDNVVLKDLLGKP